MQDVKEIEGVGDGLVLNTGSPHYIEMVDELDYIDVEKEGRKIRRIKCETEINGTKS